MTGQAPQSTLTLAQPFSRAYAHTILGLLVLVYTFNFIDRTIIATPGQAIKVDLRITDAQLGLLQGFAFAVFYTLLGVPLARLSERYNRVTIVSVCLAIWSGMTALCGAVQNYVQLFLYRAGVRGVARTGNETWPGADHAHIHMGFAPLLVGCACGGEGSRGCECPHERLISSP